ncbi:MAG: YifB family Mg chelatase-like AAA ATPase [Lachnospiraceae bacterium]|nr:YifB family Mg chelatase-like AAA ATPase [Lachnospiraceae bacterium]
MFSKTYGAAILGIDAQMIQVEADVSDGLPGYELVGYLSSEVREAKERVRVAIHNAGFVLPPKKVTINLSPADLRKEGTAFDLPIAIAILTASGYLSEEMIAHTMFCGELSLNGELNPVNGILPIVLCAKKEGLKRMILPLANRAEARMMDGIEVLALQSLSDVVRVLQGGTYEEEVVTIEQETESGELPDFKDVCGQVIAKRAIEIAVAGGHNILFTGSPGAGKTMLASRIPSIMPALTKEESLELSKIYSVAGRLDGEKGLLTARPFRAPHHTVTPIAMAGGGRRPVPGEISLASGGVLFLDEFPEYSRQTIELLRQPLEEKKITINRMAGTCDYPATFLLVAAMNPCPCGAYPNRNLCRCTEPQIRRYQGRISRPILDRIDLFLQIAPVGYEELLQQGEQESSVQIRKRVEAARKLQYQRYRKLGIHTNAELPASSLKEYCPLGERETEMMKEAFYTYQLSARAYHRMIKVARTIADLAGEERILPEHLSEAACYRNEMKL